MPRAPEGVQDALVDTARRLGLVASTALVVAMGLVFWRQLADFRDPFMAWREDAALLLGTQWGRIWTLGAAGSILMPVLFLAASPAVRRGAARRASWVLATGLALAMCAFPALTGHAAGSENLGALLIPADTLHVLRDLIDVRNVLASSHQDSSPVVQGAIDRAAPMLRGMRLGDGGLAVFNGGFEEQDWQIDMTLNQSGSTGNPPEHSAHTGFQRVMAGRTTVIMDSGMPPPPGHDDLAHAGLLSLEMSAGRSRLIVNCGSYWKPNSEWAFAGRISAAHSTLVVEDRNSSQLHRNGGLGRRPAEVSAKRRNLDGALLIEGSHDGYVPSFDVKHTRRIYVSSNGEDVRGQDILARPEQSRRNPDVEFAVRFHLHPDVSIDSMSIWEKGGRIIDFSRQGAGNWQFHTESGVTIRVEDSFYQGARNGRERTRQIVLSGEYRGAEPRAVRWAIRRR